MPDFNSDCKIEGCERESIDAIGYCKKHKPTEAMSNHHPSCGPSDRDLVWLCAQCGGHESAEELEAELERLREAVTVKDAALKLAYENLISLAPNAAKIVKTALTPPKP